MGKRPQGVMNATFEETGQGRKTRMAAVELMLRLARERGLVWGLSLSSSVQLPLGHRRGPSHRGVRFDDAPAFNSGPGHLLPGLEDVLQAPDGGGYLDMCAHTIVRAEALVHNADGNLIARRVDRSCV